MHTPGPFWLDPRGYLNIVAKDPSGLMTSGIVIASLENIPNGLPHEQKICNAQLLAASADLLAECERANKLVGNILKTRAIREDAAGFDWNLLNAVMTELPKAMAKAREF